jgi:pyridoxine kinase
VVYGYVGNKAAIYPLQSMNYDVWPVNTVQFSNHTGYKSFKGEIFSKEHITDVITGLEEIGVVNECQAILSGYIGSVEIAELVQQTVKKFKSLNDKLIYLCDPVIGNTTCFVKPEILDFFKNNLIADIITPNQYEAETLSSIKINNKETLKKVADYFHNKNIMIVVITGISFIGDNKLYIFASNADERYIIETIAYKFTTPVNGTGDLFSAVFLGNYLTSNCFTTALQYAVYYVEQVLDITQKLKAKELQVTAINYSNNKIDNLPKIIKI